MYRQAYTKTLRKVAHSRKRIDVAEATVLGNVNEFTSRVSFTKLDFSKRRMKNVELFTLQEKSGS